MTQADRIAIWGACPLGESCFNLASEQGMEVAFFIDQKPPSSGTFLGRPVIGVDRLAAAGCLDDLDAVFLAFKSNKHLPYQQLRALGFSRTIVAFRQGQRLEEMLAADITAQPDYKPVISAADIPPMDFRPGMDFILLELPPRQVPMMPYGVAYVHNILKAAGVRVQTVDLNIILYHRFHNRLFSQASPLSGWAASMTPWDGRNFDKWATPEALEYFRNDFVEAIEGIARTPPKILGISVNAPNLYLVEFFIRELRSRCPDLVVVLGGYSCIYPEVALHDIKDFDYIVMREAELTLPLLVKQLLRGERPRDIAGVLSAHDSPDRDWPEVPIPHDLDAIAFPRYDWIDLDVYRTYDGGTATPFSLGRGCKWSRCTFCGERFPFRKRNPMKVADEIEWHVRQSFTNFISMESDINGDPETLLAFCREIIRRGLEVSLFGQLRIDPRNDPVFFETLRRAGFSTLVFGVDGWCDHVLQLQRKGYSMKSVAQNLRDCHRAGIAINVNMIIGVPGETEEDVEECIRNIIANREYINAVTTINMVRLIHGSPYYQNPEKHNIRFKGDKKEIYRRDPHIIDEKLWYSVDPSIDHKVRARRYKVICRALLAAGVTLGEWAKWDNAHELSKIEGKNLRSFEEIVSEGMEA